MSVKSSYPFSLAEYLIDILANLKPIPVGTVGKNEHEYILVGEIALVDGESAVIAHMESFVGVVGLGLQKYTEPIAYVGEFGGYLPVVSLRNGVEVYDFSAVYGLQPFSR